MANISIESRISSIEKYIIAEEERIKGDTPEEREKALSTKNEAYRDIWHADWEQRPDDGSGWR